MGFLGLEYDGARPSGRAFDRPDIGGFADKWNVIRRAAPPQGGGSAAIAG
jgi:hypothetical protein